MPYCVMVGLLLLLFFAARGVEVEAWSSTRLPAVTSTTLCSGRKGLAEVGVQFEIRDSLFGELMAVSKLMVKAFYPPEKASHDMWKNLYRLAELNRLQKAFPYPPDQEKHRMLVAVSSSTDEIIGFCDIDSRPPLQPHYKNNPTPYLSDVLVDPEWRRKGVASSLIERCEKICLEQFKRNEIYIRVKEENKAAMELYTRLGYDFVPSTGDDPDICLLKKGLRANAK